MLYDPFDPKLGTLVGVEVVVQGSVSGSVIIIPDPPTIEIKPYDFGIINYLTADLERAFVSDQPLDFNFSGDASTLTPINFDRSFEYVFTCGPSSNDSGVCPVDSMTGIDNFLELGEMTASLNSFTDDGIDTPWRVFVATSFDPRVPDLGLADVVLIEGAMHIEYRYEISDDPAVFDGFEAGGLPCWVTSGSGSAAVVEYPIGTGNQMMELTAGPVTIECDLGLDQKPSEIRLDAGFRSSDGTLTLSLGGVNLATYLAGDGIPGDVSLRRIVPSDSDWAAASDSTLAIGLPGPTGAQALIDNILVLPAPEPSAALASLSAIFSVAALARCPRKS